MKTKKLSQAVLWALPLCALCSCVNGDYDLSNIDTTVKVKADNLVVPLNLDAITLNKILNLSDDSQIKEVVDPVTGEKIYAAIEKGSYLSSEIKVPDFTAPQPTIEEIQSDIINIEKLSLTPDPDAELKKYTDDLKSHGQYDSNKQKEYEQTVWEQIRGSLEGQTLCRYTFDKRKTSFTTTSSSVDKAVRSIDNIKVDATFTIVVEARQLRGITNTPLKNLMLEMPKGMTLTANHGKYNPSTGILDLTDDAPTLKNGVATYSDGETSIKLNITAINIKEAGAEFNTMEDTDGSLTIKGYVTVKSGKIEVECSDFVSEKTYFDLPAGIYYECIPEMTDIAVKAFTGNIKYAIKDVNIDPITLKNLPDILSNEQTDVILGNPQIYLKANNPATKYNVNAVSGFQFCGEKKGVKRTMYSLDNGKLTISKAMNTYCMSPTKPSEYYDGYDDAEYVKFTGLKNILSGEGLPDKINVYVVDPQIPEQKVTNFVLGEQLDKVSGEYTFFAPLSLEDGSVIVYEDTENDWNDETLDHLVVETLKVTATITSQIPLGATVTLTPLGKDGKEISGVSFTCSQLEPNAQNQTIEFVQTGGVIKNLDGVTIRATIIGSGAEKILQSVQSLDVKNLKATVSGYYEDKL